MPRTDYSDVEVIVESPSFAFARSSTISSSAPSRNLEAHSNVLVGWRTATSAAHPTLQPVSDSVLPSELSLPTDPDAATVAAGIPTDVTEAGASNLRNAAEQIWKRCMDTLRGQLSAQTMRTWFEPLEATQLDGSQITLRTPSSFFSEWISEHYDSALETAIRDVLGSSASFRFEVASDLDSLNTKLEPASSNGLSAPSPHAAPAPTPQQFRAPAPPQQQSYFQRPATSVAPAFGGAPQSQNGAAKRPLESNLNPRYTFDTFIRGESNKLAFAASNAVANNPGGTRYNPLVIYGSVGLGKTHLIQAVGNAAIQKFPAARVLYTSSDRFTVEFVDAIQNNKTNEF